MFIAPDIDTFKANFIHGLKEMLSPDGLGAFILVLANSMQDKELHFALKDVLEDNFSLLSDIDISNAPEDDRVVFTALKASGIADLYQWKTYKKEPWELIYNPLRALRPARAAQQVIREIQQAFDASKFNFNKPFLRPEILWEGQYQDVAMRVLYNKFPFAPWHLLIVPDAEKEQPQFLTQATHDMMMQLAGEQASIFTGFGLAFNSLGAYASINQLHFQGFIKDEPLPIESSHWKHNGGEADYPLDCYRCNSSEEAWQLIDSYHQKNQAYNLLYRSNYCYVLPRKLQGSVVLAEWAQGTAWYELCGVFTLSNEVDIDVLSAGDIEKTLQQLRV